MRLTKEDVWRDTRLAGQVRRYHTWPQHHHQTNGEHTWQVMRLLVMIFGTPRAEVLVYAVKHDMAEIKVGDPPYPIKAHNPALKAEMDRLEGAHFEAVGIQLPDLTPEEKVLFKFCDLLDCVEHARYELLMGNRHMRGVFDQGDALTDYIVKMSLEDARKAVLHCASLDIGLNADLLRKYDLGLMIDFNKARGSAHHVD